MKCACYCTATSYRFKECIDFLKGKYPQCTVYRDVIHIKNTGDAFIFNYGCGIFWDMPQHNIQEILSDLKPFEENVLDTPAFELFNFQVGKTTTISPDKDLIEIEADDPLVMLSISFALAQSIKLINFEDAVDKTIKSTQHIPHDLVVKGKIALSRKQISAQMGNLFLVRNSVNLNTEFLGSPEFFWENPSLEKNFVKAAAYLEIYKRVEVLNKRLDVIHELFDMLTNQLQHRHSSILELVIIWLIVIEIALVLTQEFLR
jgi:uncharacterized Rmd1/YagE family protein